MRVAVLGAGVTGLAAAWKLASGGHEVRVLEALPRIGGVVHSEATDGWLIERGPISFQESRPEITAAIRDLGLAAERIETGPLAENRYIARGGSLKALPAASSVTSFLSTPLLSMRSKLAVAGEATRKPLRRTEDVSVAELVRDHFTRDILETLVQPLIGGMYAGDAEKLSLQYAFPRIWAAERETGSLVKAAAEASRRRKAEGLPSPPPLISFRRGLQALPAALAARLPDGALVLGAEVKSAIRERGRSWKVGYVRAGKAAAYACDAVISALPAWSLARLELGTAGRHPLESLAGIAYAPVASLFFGYRRERVSHPLDGFGALVPPNEQRSALGVVFISSLFPDRAPAGHVALNVFAGGTLQPALAALGKAELVERVGADLRDLVGADGPPAFASHTLWPRAIPQYNLGYGRHLDAMARCEADHPGFLVGGCIRDGISLPECLLAGLRLAERAS